MVARWSFSNLNKKLGVVEESIHCDVKVTKRDGYFCYEINPRER